MEGGLAEALESAMIRIVGEVGALGTGRRRQFSDILRRHCPSERSLQAAWEETQVAGTADVRRLAGLLARRADGDERLRAALWGWVGRHAGAGRDGAEQVNVLADGARIHGTSLQARDVHGGIHVHHAAPAASPPPVPRQLPPASANFVGRDRELTELDAARAAHRAASPQVVVVSGPAGVGKTALAVTWLHRLVEEFPDGQLFADLRGHEPTGPLGATEVLERFLRALGVTAPPSQPADRVALWRSLTAELRLALLLDNALTAAQVRPLLPAGSDSLVVVTSRRRLTGLVVDGAVLYHLDVLEQTAAVELLDRGGGGGRVAREAAAAREVVALCARLPLAVCLAAAQLAARPQRSVSAMVEALTRRRGPLHALRVEGEAAISAALDDSYVLLTDDVAEAYRRLGLLPVTRYDAELLAGVCGIPPEAAEELLDALVDSSLLQDLGPDGCRFHDLVRPHARECADRYDTDASRTRTLRRFVEWCLASATAAEELVTPSHRNLPRDYTAHPPVRAVTFRDDRTAVAWLDRHRDTLMEAVRHAFTVRWDAACWQLVDAMWPLFLRLRPAELWIEAHQLGLKAARRAQDRIGVTRMLTSGGNGLRNADRLDEAAEWYEEALRYAEDDGDVRQQAQALHNLGNVRLRTGRLDEAEVLLTRALELRRSIDHRRGVALTLVSLGQVAFARGDHEHAARRLEAGRAGLAAEGDTYDAARARALLGQVAARAGDPATGTRHLRQALADFETTGARPWQGRTLEMLGQVAEESGDEAGARRWYERSRELYRTSSPRDTRRLEDRLRDLG